jgi:hypothetical protein
MWCRLGPVMESRKIINVICFAHKARNVSIILATSFSKDLLCIKLIALNTVELHLFGLIGTVRHPDMQKIRIIGFFIEDRLHWQFEVRLLLYTIYTCILTFRPRRI